MAQMHAIREQFCDYRILPDQAVKRKKARPGGIQPGDRKYTFAIKGSVEAGLNWQVCPKGNMR
jgi:hypothetical protein